MSHRGPQTRRDGLVTPGATSRPHPSSPGLRPGTSGAGSTAAAPWCRRRTRLHTGPRTRAPCSSTSTRCRSWPGGTYDLMVGETANADTSGNGFNLYELTVEPRRCPGDPAVRGLQQGAVRRGEHLDRHEHVRRPRRPDSGPRPAVRECGRAGRRVLLMLGLWEVFWSWVPPAGPASAVRRGLRALVVVRKARSLDSRGVRAVVRRGIRAL